MDSEADYYKLLDLKLRPHLSGKRMLFVSAFSNAAMILFGKSKKSKINFIPPSDLFLMRGNKLYAGSKSKYKGFGFI